MREEIRYNIEERTDVIEERIDNTIRQNREDRSAKSEVRSEK